MKVTRYIFGGIIVAGFCALACAAKVYEATVSNSLGRIGVRMNCGSGGINKVYKGSPADLAGIQVGDVITAVDGRHRHFDDIEGAPGTVVRLEIRRGKEHYSFDIERVDVREIKK